MPNLLVVHDLIKTCNEPNCQRRAEKRVNLKVFADYMAKHVCEEHIGWAEAVLMKSFRAIDR